MKKIFLLTAAVCVLMSGCGDVDDTGTIKNVTISFDLFYDGAPQAPESVTIKNNQKIGELPAVSARAGFVFQGWFRYSGNGNWKKVTTADTFGSDTTLYARWGEDIDITIMFYLNYWGSPEPPSDRSIAKGSALPADVLAMNLTREGFVFQGWSASRSDGSIVTATDTFNANTSLYAQWQDMRVDVVITYDLNYTGAPQPPQSVTIKSGDILTIDNIPVVSRDFPNMFLGWFTAAVGGEQVARTTVLAAMTTTGNAIQKTLYARWLEASYIEVDLSGRLQTNQTPGTHQTAPTNQSYTQDGLTVTFSGTANQSLQIPLTNAQRSIISGLNADQTIQVLADWTATPVSAMDDEPVFRFFIGRIDQSSNWDGTSQPDHWPAPLSQMSSEVLGFTTSKASGATTTFILQLRNGYDVAVDVNIKSIYILYDPNWTP